MKLVVYFLYNVFYKEKNMITSYKKLKLGDKLCIKKGKISLCDSFHIPFGHILKKDSNGKIEFIIQIDCDIDETNSLKSPKITEREYLDFVLSID